MPFGDQRGAVRGQAQGGGTSGLDVSPLPALPLGRVSLGAGFGGVLGGREGGSCGGAGCRRPRHALPHPRRRRARRIALRCQDNGNSYTLLFILKDTCSYLSLQSPQKIACHAKIPPR